MIRDITLPVVALLSGAIAFGAPGAATVPAVPAPGAVDIRFQDVDVRDAFRLLARLAGRNILLGREVRGRLTLDLTGVDPIKSIDLIAAVNRYEVLVRDGILVVGEAQTLAFVRGTGTLEILPIRYGNAVELADRLSKLYKGKLEITADPRSNSILIMRPGP